MWYEFLLEGTKNFAGEIIGLLLLTVALWAIPGLRSLFMKFRKLEKGDSDDSKIQQVMESQRELALKLEEVLRRTDTHKNIASNTPEESKRNEAIQKQLESERKEKERIRAELLQIQVKSQQQVKANNKPPTMSDSDFLELCESGDALKVEKAISNGANVNARDKLGETALMKAAWNGYTKIAEILIKHGTDINANKYGVTALMYAAWNGQAELAEVLIKHGADINAKANNGQTSLIMAEKNNHSKVAQLLRYYSHKPKLLPMNDNDFIKLCEAGDALKVDEAISNGANVNAKINGFWSTLLYGSNTTALISAAREGYAEVTKVLIKHGADVNAHDYYGYTALMLSAREGHKEVAEILLKHGANVNAQNISGWTALMLSAWRSHAEIEQLLRSYGAKY